MSHSVLIVEDSETIVMSLDFLMRKEGHDVRVAHDGEAALAAIGENVPDLILLDVQLPGRNGFDVCAAIRENPDCDGVRIVMLTARGTHSEREAGLAAGADDYIVKPFANRDVVDCTRRLLGIGTG